MASYANPWRRYRKEAVGEAGKAGRIIGRDRSSSKNDRVHFQIGKGEEAFQDAKLSREGAAAM